MLVQNGLETNAAFSPDKTVLVCGSERLTYAQLDSMANRVANWLIASGVKRGDRVAIYLPNTVEAVVGIFGILKAGAVFVVVNRSTKFEKLSFVLGDCEAAGLITEARVAVDGTVANLLARHSHLRCVALAGDASESVRDWADCVVSLSSIQAEYPAAKPRITTIDVDLACLVYTSGSTGEPKGVMCDHSNVVFVTDSIISYLGNNANDVTLNVLPLSFGYGLYQLTATTMSGGTLVLENGFAFPGRVLERIGAEHVTGLPSVPTLFAALLNMDLTQFDLSSLRYITNAAAALPPSHIRRMRQKLPGVTIYSMYGLTETQRTLYLPPEQLDYRPDSVGIAIPGTEVWLERRDGSRAAPGETGELVARGRHVMRGYWNAPEATAKRFRLGPLPGERVCYTGDLFRTDAAGFLYFVSRKDDIIKTRGEKVAPREVENVIHTLPGVVQAAVIGVPDPILGQAVKAVLIADADRVTPEQVIAHCRARLEDFMVPKYVEFADHLPTTASGKVLKRSLAQCAGSLE